MTLRKIADIPRPCMHPEHNPPGHIVLEPGIYEHTCPGCGRTVQFRVDGPYMLFENGSCVRRSGNHVATGKSFTAHA